MSEQEKHVIDMLNEVKEFRAFISLAEANCALALWERADGFIQTAITNMNEAARFYRPTLTDSEKEILRQMKRKVLKLSVKIRIGQKKVTDNTNLIRRLLAELRPPTNSYVYFVLSERKFANKCMPRWSKPNRTSLILVVDASLLMSVHKNNIILVVDASVVLEHIEPLLI